MSLARRVGLIAVAAVLVALVVLLWQIRPAFPAVSRLFTTARLEQAFGFLGWFGAVVLVLGLLDRTARSAARRPWVGPLPLPSLAPTPRQPRPAVAIAGCYSTKAFPLIPRPRPSPDDWAAPLHENGSNSSSTVVVPTTVHDGRGDTAPTESTPAPRSEPRASIALLGPLTITVTRNGRRPLGGATEQLLCYLALRPQGAHHDQLIDILWADQPTQRLRKRLWRTIGDAREHLGKTAITREGETYRLNRDQVAVDVDELERLLKESTRPVEPHQRLTQLSRALELFRDQPLTGADYLWADGDIRRLTASHIDLLQQTSEALLDAHRATEALAIAERGIAIDPSNERLARVAMKTEATIGQRTAVVARYDSLTRTLDAQLGLRPSADTRTLYRQLLGQDPNEPADMARAVKVESA